jgi:hypothetical protein
LPPILQAKPPAGVPGGCFLFRTGTGLQYSAAMLVCFGGVRAAGRTALCAIGDSGEPLRECPVTNCRTIIHCDMKEHPMPAFSTDEQALAARWQELRDVQSPAADALTGLEHDQDLVAHLLQEYHQLWNHLEQALEDRLQVLTNAARSAA